MNDDARARFAARLNDQAETIGRAGWELAELRKRVALTDVFDQKLLMLAVNSAKVSADACRLLADRANRRDT